jgi:NTE family protein
VRRPRRSRTNAFLVLTALCLLARPPLALATCTSSVALDAPTTLVLSGGGAKGAWEAGAAATLVRRGLALRLAAGSSAGALNAAMLADGRVERLDGLWRTLRREQVYALRASVFFAGLLPGWLTLLSLDAAGSLFDPRPLRELIAASVDLDRIRASAVRLLVTTSDLVRRETRRFDNRTLSVDALMAATALPGAFPPVDVDGTLLVDGGLTGRAPVLEALEADPSVSRALVVMSYAPDERGARPSTLRRALEEAFEMAMIHQIRRDTELARLKYPAVDVQLLTPSAPLRVRPLEFDAAAIARLLELGGADATACLEAWARSPRSER